MSEKKRKSKRPKAIQAKRVTTEATKAKLPRPKRKKPANVRLRPDTPTPDKVQCPRCEKWLRPGPHDIHTCYDAKALRAVTLNETSGGATQGFTPRAIPCGEDVQMFVSTHTGGVVIGSTRLVELAPPDTSAYPWPLKWAWKLDGWLAKLARRFA